MASLSWYRATVTTRLRSQLGRSKALGQTVMTQDRGAYLQYSSRIACIGTAFSRWLGTVEEACHLSKAGCLY